MAKIKVLVIDDEEDLLKIIKMNLEATGKYEVMALSSAKDLIKNVHNFLPGVILIDVLMPEISGIEACEMLNNDTIGKGIPLIILSALGKDMDKLKAYRAGAVDYLVKPIQTEELVKKIDKALQYK